LSIVSKQSSIEGEDDLLTLSLMHKTSMKLDPMKQGVSSEKSLLHTDDFVLLTIKKKPCIFSGATPLQMFEVKGWSP
jgi:hypothetical protein